MSEAARIAALKAAVKFRTISETPEHTLARARTFFEFLSEGREAPAQVDRAAPAATPASGAGRKQAAGDAR